MSGVMEASGIRALPSEYRQLEYQLVEIVNQPPLDPSPEALAKDPKAEQLDVDGKAGQTLAWAEEQQKYIVETFDGDLVAITEDHLRPYQPPPVAEGGFDLAFPGSENMAEAFQAQMADLLIEKKYCIVQMTIKPVDRKACTKALQELDNWARFMPEFEAAYMGHRPEGKRVQWYIEEAQSFIEEDQTDVGIKLADTQMTNLSIAICNICPYLGFNGVCRSNAMLHMNCSNAQEEMNLLDEARGHAVGAGVIQGHLAFRHRRKICMLYFVHGSGGTLTLHPTGDQDISLPCREGQVIVFRHDLCDYTYLPEGKQLALQAWVFREQHAGELSLSQPEILAYEDIIEAIPKSPAYGNTGQTVDIMSLSARIPGMVNTPESYWTGLSSGYDGVIRIPGVRWDHDLYFDEVNPDTPGKAYTQHKGLLDNDTQMFSFDNEFFDLTEDEVQRIDPPARNILEVGYDCLHRGGWTRQKLLGTNMVCVYGNANNEFEGLQLRGVRMPIDKETKLCLSLGNTAARLHYTFGMTGRCSTVETACSSSLTAIAMVHSHIRPDQNGQMKLSGANAKFGMGMGSNGHFDPFFMIGLCGAKMLSHKGRCFTFDQSGDGFVRGEACCGMFFKVNEGEDLARLAMLCGSCMNQDGRSASLTAPHGPSQQECIRHSLREAGVPPLLIQIQELHGTGTALGDPIEVGALRATMMMVDGEIREHPLVKTSSKSNIGHTELSAGICGIMKCVLMGVYTSACPNNHIRLLNPHIDSNGYPVYFCTEFVDQGKSSGYMGVSSFGFGGSNARGDIWSRALCGPRNTDPGESRPQFTAQRIRIWAEANKATSLPKPAVCTNAEAALDSLDDYQDAYLVGEAPGDDDELYCIGTFNGWTAPEKMTYVEASDSYVFALPLGEACVEQFQICMNKNENFKIFPASKFANQDAIVLGPGIAPAGNNWVIDGRPQAVSQGTVYQITLQWDLETRRKSVSWEPSRDEGVLELARELRPFRHQYYILASWNTWKPLAMQPVGSEPGTFETTVKVGLLRHEEFRFQRDADKTQAIYPARNRPCEAGEDTSRSQSVPICGPDHLGEGKHWMFDGAMGDTVKIRLRIWEGEITMQTVNHKVGVQTWTNEHAAAKRRYFVTATWNDWGYTMMDAKPDKMGYSDVHTLKVTMPQTQMVAFQIAVDEDATQTIHPEMALTDQLLSPALGPDAKGEGLYWGMYAVQGAAVKIKLDLSQEDRRKVVTWTLE